MKLKPLQDWAVIVPAVTERTAGGLYIPDTAKEKPEEGVVEAIGPGAYEEEKRDKKKEEKKERKFIPSTVKPGDRVLFERWSSQAYTIDNQEKILVRERNILGLLDRPPEIPAATSASSPTAIAPRPVPPPLMKKQDATVKTRVEKKEAKPAEKPAAKKKAAKKTAKKTVKKAAAKPKKASVKSGKTKKTGKKK